MIYAQVDRGQKLHLVCEPGEELRGEVIRAGSLSAPLCGRKVHTGYRMTTNVPLFASACKICLRVFNSARPPWGHREKLG